MHHYDSSEAKVAANEKCCGLEKISNGLNCCNYIGYSSATQVCADFSHQQNGGFHSAFYFREAVYCLFVCVEVLRPSQPKGVMSSAVSLPNHTFTVHA